MPATLSFLRSSGRSAFARPDRRPIYDWAADHVNLSGNTTITGKFNVTHSRYLIEPFDALQSDHVRTICVRAPVRSGKTLIADVWLPWVIANDPGPFQWNMGDDALAKYHAETRAMPVLETCLPVRDLLPRVRHKKRTQSILFRHGMPFVIQGPSIGRLQGRGIRYQVNDETWEWEPGRHAQAIARLGDYEELGCSKELNLSQGGIEGDDEDVRFKQGQLREWRVPCVACGHRFWPDLRMKGPDNSVRGLTWEEIRDTSGDWNVEACTATARFLCPACGHTHSDSSATRAYWNAAGAYAVRRGDGTWSPSEPFSHHVSYTWSGLCTRSWDAIVREQLQAINALRAGVVEPLIVFTQKRIPRPWSEQILFDASPAPTFDPATAEFSEEDLTILTVDRQSGGLHWGVVWRWNSSGKSWRLWFGKLIGEDDIVTMQNKFEILPNHVLIDCGFEGKIVFAMCIRRGWIAVRGDSRASFQWHARDRAGKPVTILKSYSRPQKGDPEIGKIDAGRRYATVIPFSDPTYKDRLQRHLERGLHTEPQADPTNDLENEYKRQMRSEYKRRTVNRITGQVKEEWVCPSRNNHAFDCAKMQILAATLLKIRPDMEAPV